MAPYRSVKTSLPNGARVRHSAGVIRYRIKDLLSSPIGARETEDRRRREESHISIAGLRSTCVTGAAALPVAARGTTAARGGWHGGMQASRLVQETDEL